MSRGLLVLACALLALLLVAGTALAVTRHCNGGKCRGTGTADRLYGSAGNDTIYAAGGNDKAFGREGDDWLKGGTGNDELYGEESNDKVKGHMGRDMVFGGPGDDFLRGGTADQTNDGSRDIIDCGEGTDTVVYTPGVDEIRDCEILNPPE
jgi:Ca2+-binding RTX toxin-like protein